MRNFYLMVILSIACCWQIQAQVTLAAGDIAFTGFNSDNPDQFSIVALTDIAAGTELIFTDNGWQSSGGFRANEGTSTFTFEVTTSCGDEFLVDVGTMNLSASGDQILAYQTDMAGDPTFIAAINFNGPDWTDATTPNTSALPPGLTAGFTALNLGETDNAAYDCGEGTSGMSMTQNDWLNTLNNADNWVTDNSDRYILPTNCIISCADDPQPMGCDELFISEYIEGSSSNKCLELYNPTMSPITLDDDYYLLRYSNGNSTSTFISLQGTIAPGDVHVICNSSAGPVFLAEADQTSGSISHTGNDAYELYRVETLIDAFGQLGVSSNYASNVTLVRKPEVTSGDTDSSDAFDPSEEYDAFPSNTSDDLGSHTSDCMPQMNNCMITAISQTAIGICNDNGSPYVTDDTYTTSIQVDFADGPASGDLVLEINGEVIDMVSADLDGTYTFNVDLAADGGSVLATAFFTADPSCTLTVALANAPEPCSMLTACDYLFFSEYVEGSNNNKCLEIYNPTDIAVDLSTYGVFLSFNGGSFETTVPLSGVVEAGDVFVICNSGATSEFLALADATSTQINFNGNDAVLLNDAFGTIDAIGQRGVDPGSEWNNNGVGTRDETLRRKFFVQSGDNNPNDAFDPSQEWNSYPQNTSFGLGYHGSPCQPSLGPGIDPVGIGGCNDRTLDIQDESTFSITTSCAPNNPYQDEQAAALQEVCNPNSSVTVQVDVTPSGNAGVTYRASLANNSAKVFFYTKANNRVYWSVRGMTGGIEQTNFRYAYNINYLRITRMGNVYRGFISNNGFTFQQVFVAQVNLGECPQAGVAVYSYTDGVPVTATFSNLVISQGSGTALQAQTNTTATPDAAGGDLNLAPNPATDWVSVAWPTTQSGKASLQIRDLNGRLVQQREIYLEDGSLHLVLHKELAPGMYVMSIQNGKEIWTKRFIKAQ